MSAAGRELPPAVKPAISPKHATEIRELIQSTQDRLDTLRAETEISTADRQLAQSFEIGRMLGHLSVIADELDGAW